MLRESDFLDIFKEFRAGDLASHSIRPKKVIIWMFSIISIIDESMTLLSRSR